MLLAKSIRTDLTNSVIGVLRPAPYIYKTAKLFQWDQRRWRANVVVLRPRPLNKLLHSHHRKNCSLG